MQSLIIKIISIMLLVMPLQQERPEAPKVELTPSQVWAEAQLSQMNLPQKIGQMILTGIDGKTMTDDERRMIHSGQIGGIIFLGHNVKTESQFMDLVGNVSQGSGIPLILAIDQEGGRVQRLPLDRSDFPSALEIGSRPESAFDQGQVLGSAVKRFGLNVNLAPVLDVFSNPQNKVIGNRAFGRTPETVAYVGVDVMQGIQSQGIAACVKHFPGHGDTTVDSHEGLPVIEHDAKRLMAFEWIPFKRAIDAGADMIMTAHVLIPALDEKYPATLSRTIVGDYLRGQLGYDGIVMTDDLVMGAISKKYTYSEAVRLAVEAGVDMLLISSNDYVDEIQHTLYSAVKDGEMDEARIDASVMRILELKYKYIVESQEENSVD